MNFKKNWKRFFTVSRASEGFTLVELIVVIAILAILAGIAVPAYSGYIKKANKAADLQLLGAVNTAFAAACLQNNVDVNEVTGAAMPLTSTGTINMAGVTPYKDEFATYFAGNEASAFKVITALYFDAANGCFAEISGTYATAYNYLVENYPDQITAFQNSAYSGIGSTALLNQVNDVTDMASQMIAAGSGSLYNLVMNEEYAASVASTLGMSSEEFNQMFWNEMTYAEQCDLLARSTVVTVAQTMSNADTMNDMKETLATGNFGTIATSIQNSSGDVALAQAAALYGMYTAFKPEAAANISDITDFDALIDMTSDPDFATYLRGLEDSESQASKDLAGYTAALAMVNGAVGNDTNVANQVISGGYNDPQLIALLNQALAGNS